MGSSVKLEEIATVLSREDARFHQETVADLVGTNQIKFPGAQPVSFARHHFQELESKDYFLCEKTDGIRCLLYLTQHIEPGRDAQELQFLIDRKNNYWYVEGNYMHLPVQGNVVGFHTATLLDGELVRQNYKNGTSRLMYLIFDCMCLDGKSIMDRELQIRLGKCGMFVYEPWKKLKEHYPKDVDEQPFWLQLKKMEMPYGAEHLIKNILPNLPHGNDGLIFTCQRTPYTSGTDQHILKWKPPHENTIDFRLQIHSFPMREYADGTFEDWDAEPTIDLLVDHGRPEGHRHFATLSLTDQEWETMKSMNEQFDGRIIECYREAATGHWRPKLEHHDGTPRFRDDKASANHISTVESVVRSIEDGVTEEDLIAGSGRIKEAWKKREAEAKARRDEEKKRAWEAVQERERERKRLAMVGNGPPKQVEEDDGPRYAE